MANNYGFSTNAIRAGYARFLTGSQFVLDAGLLTA